MERIASTLIDNLSIHIPLSKMEFNIFYFLISKIFKFILIYFTIDLNSKNFILEIYLLLKSYIIDCDRNKL